MNVHYYRLPHKASKKKIHKGEEATASRISCANPFFNGLVERKERLERPHVLFDKCLRSQSFHIKSLYVHADSDTANGQIMKYRTLRLAHALFPENFPRARALRFSKRDGRQYGSMYSDFVPDETGCIPRKEKYLKECYKLDSETSPDAKGIAFDSLRTKKREFNQDERMRCPQISTAENAVKEAGILITHPEANYHVVGGKPVFFEPENSDFELAMAHARTLNGTRREKAMVQIGLLCLAALPESLQRLEKNGKLKDEWRSLAEAVRSGNSAFMRAFLRLVKEDVHFLSMVGGSDESFVKAIAERLAF
ncbi:MAG: hypothetical protein WC861_06170 [Candidatus Micrarchaeia archaeon]|jgi:hypothetical protein